MKNISGINFCQAEKTINALKEVLKEARSNIRFKVLWDADVVATRSSVFDEPEMPRKRKTPSRFTGNGVPYFATTPEDHYCQLYYASLDFVITEFATRFEPMETTEHLANVEKFIIDQCLDVRSVEPFYKGDFEDYGRLKLNCDIFVDHPKFKNIQLNHFESVLCVFVGHDGALSQIIRLIPEFVKPVKCYYVCLSHPVRVSDLFCLRRLKTYLRLKKMSTSCFVNFMMPVVNILYFIYISLR